MKLMTKNILNKRFLTKIMTSHYTLVSLLSGLLTLKTKPDHLRLFQAKISTALFLSITTDVFTMNLNLKLQITSKLWALLESCLLTKWLWEVLQSVQMIVYSQHTHSILSKCGQLTCFNQIKKVNLLYNVAKVLTKLISCQLQSYQAISILF